MNNEARIWHGGAGIPVHALVPAGHGRVEVRQRDCGVGEMKEILRRCPFCGGQAALQPANVYISQGWRVRCTKCKIGTLPILINTPEHNSKGSPDESTRYTSEQAANVAVDKWNRREPDTDNRAMAEQWAGDAREE